MKVSRFAGVGLLCSLSSLAAAQEQITFTKHVAPIIQQKCQVCHSPNSVAPMSLITYKDVKDYANDMLPKLKNHLDEAKDLQNKLAGSSPSGTGTDTRSDAERSPRR